MKSTVRSALGKGLKGTRAAQGTGIPRLPQLDGSCAYQVLKRRSQPGSGDGPRVRNIPIPAPEKLVRLIGAGVKAGES